jgi:hypothetical protein
MKDKSHSAKFWLVAWALILCAIAWGILFFSWGSKTEKAHPLASAAASPRRPAATPPTTRSDDATDPPSLPLLTIPSKGGFSGTVRLKRGESAVLAYSELAPGMYQAVIISPELQPDGKVNLKPRLVRMTEEEISHKGVKDLFPDIFEIERQGVLSQQQLNDFLASTAKDGKARASEVPAMITQPGEGMGFALSGTNEDGSPFNDGKALMLSMTPEPLGDSGGFDLKYDLNHLDPPASNGALIPSSPDGSK